MVQTFKDYRYEHINIDETVKKAKNLIEDFNKASSLEEAIYIIDSINKIRKYIDTHTTLVHIRASIDTRDEFYNEERDFYDENMPKFQHLDSLFYQALSQSNYQQELRQHYGDQLFKLAEVALKTYDPSIDDLLVKENKLVSKYDKLIASAEIEFKGETLNLSQFSKYLIDDNRNLRREAYHVRENFFKDNMKEIDEIYDQLVKIRHQIAIALGYDNFTELGYYRMQRIGYDKSDVKVFRQQVEKHVVPITKAINKQHAKRINVEQLKSYDLNYTFKTGAPKPRISSEEIVKQAKKMYRELSNETGEFIDFMIERDLLDLEAKKGKESGGYCTIIEDYQSPFIFANFSGTQGDIEVMTHEAGHAFQTFESLNYSLPEYHFPTHEACEIHSMSMEYLTYPWMKYFFKEDTDKFFVSHLEGNLNFLPYGVAIDEFQHKVYENPHVSVEERRQFWKDIEKKYLPDRDYDEIEHLTKGAFWHRQGHLFGSPFYYIDYTLATICAMQFYIKHLESPETAWNDYLKICRIGGSQSFTEIIQSVPLLSPFEKGTVERVVNNIYEQMKTIDQSKF